jgi:hypothetical protein
MNFFIKIIFVVLAAAFSVSSFAGLNDAYIKVLIQKLDSADEDQKIKACREIYEWGGFSDPALFEFIANKIRAGAYGSSGETDLKSWHMKALIASGDDQYAPLLKAIEETTRFTSVKKIAASASKWLPYFREWNRQFSTVPFDSADNDPRRVAAYKALLLSQNDEILKAVYRRIYDYSGIQDKSLFDPIARSVIEELKQLPTDRIAIDQFAWKLKVLSASGLEDYRVIIEQAVTLSASQGQDGSKLNRHALTALSNIDMFKAWNDVLNRTEHESETTSPRVADWLDLVVYGDTRMKTFAIRQAYGAEVYDEKLNNIIVAQLENAYPLETRNGHEIDYQLWSGRWIEQNPNAASIELLTKISQKSPNAKVRIRFKRAVKGLR